MPLTAGTRLGSYEIVGALGAGGMGEVYRARDATLGRDVAIKILPELFLTDQDRVARFQREAQLLAALNHPNIAGIYGLGETGQTRFFVMELVDGESLSARLKAHAPLSVAESLAIARQIVDALEAAHEKGIVHRDLKPANIMLTPDGQVKVLDFGLAKHDAGSGAGSGGPGPVTHSPTLSFATTQTGVILGTAAYMSPEQARGRAADKRSDVWAFGCVLFEMLAGRRAFDGDDPTDVIAAIVRGEPDWDALPRAVPAPVRSLLKRCLDKDRKARIPDISVVRFLMADADRAARAADAAPNVSRARAGSIAAIALVAGAVAASLATWSAMRSARAPRSQPMRFVIVPAADQPIVEGNPDRNLTISPDGGRIVYISGASGPGPLMVRPIDELAAAPIRGIVARAPFISPDGSWVGYFDSGNLKKISTSGGPSAVICRISGSTRGSTWGPGDTIVYATNDTTTGLFSVPAAGGQSKLLTTPDQAQGEIDHVLPSFLPDGRAVLFTILLRDSPDKTLVAALDLATGQRKTLIRGASQAEYVDPSNSTARTGHLVYATAGGLQAVRFDPVRLEVLGNPVPVTEPIAVSPASGAANFAISRSGTLIYMPGGGGSARTLTWVDRRGAEQPLKTPPRAYLHPRWSPDGTRIAVAIGDQDQDIWVLDRVDQRLTKLTFDPAAEQHPIWTPDGQHIIFSSARSGVSSLLRQRADGSGAIERLASSPSAVIPFSISPDETSIVVGIESPETGPDLGLLRLDGRGRIEPLIQAPQPQIVGEISPDGRWLAYQSNESGASEIYVRPFPNVNAGRWLVSTTGGAKPAWARSGRELFYIDSNDRMIAVPIRATPTFAPGNPTPLFDARSFSHKGVAARTYDVSPDGQTFLMIKESVAADATTSRRGLVVVPNWSAELAQRLPAAR